MSNEAVPVVPATVPTARVLRVERRAYARPAVTSADPAVVPEPHPTRLVPEVLTPEQVARLRAENADLRQQLERVRAS